jgi:tetratricopeptide (TPR) repeat protein
LRNPTKARKFLSRCRAIRFLSSFLLLFVLGNLRAQAPPQQSAAHTGNAVSAEKALELAQKGRCKEAVPALKRVLSSQASADTRKSAGGEGLRCALAIDDRDSTTEIARLMYKQFNDDPDVLFMLVHAYSDLSTRAAQDLGRKAPQSLAAHKLNVEALEMQGKWDEAEHEYEIIIQKNPGTPGFHFLLGRLLLSRPDPDGKLAQRAKDEFQKEIDIDPKNAPAHYILGELAGRAGNWDDAIGHFTEATKLDPNFAEAYVGLGLALISVKRYEEAIPALKKSEALTPGNPSIHYGLATAYSRLGQKEEADKEFAIHRQLTESKPASERPANQ